MNLKQELRDLAAEGSDASISLMRDLVMQNPQHAKMAFELWAENGSETATDSIFYFNEGISWLSWFRWH